MHKNKSPGPGPTAPPQVLTRESPACFKLSQHPGLASMAIPPRTLAQPFLRAALTWAEPLCCSCTRCTPPVCQSPSGPEAPSCYPAGRKRLRAAPVAAGRASHTALHTQPQGSISHQPQINECPLLQIPFTGSSRQISWKREWEQGCTPANTSGQVAVTPVCSLTQQGADQQTPKFTLYPAPVLLLSHGILSAGTGAYFAGCS